MELRSYIQWSVNQYLDLIQLFKQPLYKQNSNFQPNLIERVRLKKLLYLTLLFNEENELLEDTADDILSEIEKILDSLYEKVHGYWKEKYSTHMNLWKYSINVEYSYNCFFLQLFIVELFMAYSEDQMNLDWIEECLIDVPILCERSREIPEVYITSKYSIEPTKDMQRLGWLLKSNRKILDIPEKVCFRLDTLAVYSFYEKYFYMKQINKCKDTLYTVDGVDLINTI